MKTLLIYSCLCLFKQYLLYYTPSDQSGQHFAPGESSFEEYGGGCA